MHVWNQGKITPDQEKHACAANDLHRDIQKRMRDVYAVYFTTDAANITLALQADRTHQSLLSSLAECEARLWSASKPVVRAIRDSSAVVQALLREHPPHPQDACAAEVIGHAEVVSDTLQNLTSIQASTMLTDPAVLLAYTIANECSLAAQQGFGIDDERYRWWAEQARVIPHKSR